MVIVEGIVYMYGGIGSSIYEDIIYYKLDEAVWSKLKFKELIGFPRYSHCMMAYENYLVVFGGICKLGKKRGFQNDIRTFDLKTNKWDIWETNNYAVPPRFNHAFCIFKSIMFIHGG